MIGELNIYGFYVPWGLLMFLGAVITVRIISWGLAKFGLYRYIWHPALFECALVVIVMGFFFLIGTLRGF